MLRVLTLSSLFPDATRPNFGLFVARQTLGLAARAGVAVSVVAPVGLPPGALARVGHYAPLRRLPTREHYDGLDVHRPRFTTLPMTGGRFHAAAAGRALVPTLDAIRRDFPFDVIDVSFFFPSAVAAIDLGRRYGVPVSVKARGADIHHWGNAPATAGQVRATGQAADGLLAVSKAMRDDMVALGMPGDRIRVHYTGVDRARFVPVDRPAAKAALGVAGPLILSVGALIPRKGHDIVMRAIAALPGTTLVIAGEGPERARLRSLAAELGIADRVRLAGSVPHADLPGLVAAADVMAMASASEGLANAWVEALACGTPIAIPAIGGAREVVTTASAGRIVARDPAAFAVAIADLVANPPCQAAVRACSLRFTWSANASGLHDHLAGLVDQFRRGPSPRHAIA